MKNKIVTRVILAGFCVLMVSCNTKKDENVAIDLKQVKKEIQEKENEYAATYNAGQLKEIGYYAEDAITFYQNRPPIIGKEARTEFLKSDLANNTNVISFETKEVFVSNDGKMVVEVGYYKVTDSTNTPINTGNYMSLFEKRDGKYVCLRDMSASDGLTE
ncbi:YybH family protein [Flavobacterium ginsenosidimutans]|uniref:Nuclear transport factor 2 family protein n=1 Tax=Flavobacterium ginsenosidimutans TaxID=687844 RepID=A0ABZ2Q9J3_9FLAO|nr:nuclear transport factor 2 family protein [Flavobacterium ginsenosidimutans]KAF2338806.1 nuclear transport factor 2 family protein [Flavobacterium ginsenosidimutans]